MAIAAVCGGSQPSVPVPIRIGSLIEASGQHVPQWVAALEASAKDVNRHGGINGRPVVIDECDDHLDPNQAQACVRQLVSDRVVATAGNLTLFGQVDAPILDEQGIPEVGSEALSRQETTVPTAFPLIGGSNDFIPALVVGMKRRGVHSMIIAANDDPPGQVSVDLARSAARAAGIAFLGEVPVPDQATDFTPFVQAAMQMNADAIYIGLSPPLALRFLAASRTAGARFQVAIPAGELTPRDIEGVGGAGAVSENSIEFDGLPPPSAVDLFPALRTFFTDMDAELASGDQAAALDLRSAGNLMPWLAVQVIARLASKLPVVTAATLLRALRTSPTVDTLGLTPPWTPGKTGPASSPRTTNPWGYFSSQENAVEVLLDPTPFNPFQALATG